MYILQGKKQFLAIFYIYYETKTKGEMFMSVQVRGPKCNWRLMDIKKNTIGEIERKCDKCNKLINIKLAGLQVNTRAV